MSETPWSLETSAAQEQLRRFIAEKCDQVRAEVRAPEHPMGPSSKALFAAAERGDWREALDILAAIRESMRGKQGPAPGDFAIYPIEWAAWLEIGSTLQEFAAGNEKYALAFGRDIIASIPPGSIYFGGTDWGRFMVTALCRSQVKGDPFFILTQNALADNRSYLRYVRGMYGNQIHIPNEQETLTAFDQYQQELKKRHQEGKLLPGEIYEEGKSITELRSQIAVMAVNGLLAKLMFERNPVREFYVEESFPLNWMYPHLVPHGLIMKINRQPILELSEEVIQRDRAYWTSYVTPLIGAWLRYETPVSEIVAWVRKTHIAKDLKGFTGDTQYLKARAAQQSFSKLRSSIAGIYAWRADNSTNAPAKPRMQAEADFGFRQAWALCPASPEAVFRYVNLLIGQQHLEDALLVAEAALDLESNTVTEPPPLKVPATSGGQPLTQLGHLVEQLKRMKQKRRHP